MIDFPPNLNAGSVWMELYLILLYMGVIFVNRGNALNVGTKINVTKRCKINYGLMVFFVIIILVTFWWESDFFHYKYLVNEYYYLVIYMYGSISESFYNWLIPIINCNYLLFRIIVWGFAVLITLRVYKKFNVNLYLALYTLISMYICTHFVSRVCLALAVYFMGFTLLICEPHKNSIMKENLRIIGGICLILSSLKFHNSMIFLIAIFPIIFMKFNKNTFKLLIVSIPLLIAFVKFGFNFVLENDLISHPELNTQMARYATRVDPGINILGLLPLILECASFYYPFSVIALQTYNNFKEIKVEYKPILSLFKLTLGIMIVATTFGLMNFGSSWYFKRVLWMSAIPMTILMSFYYKVGYLTRAKMVLLLNLGTLFNLYRLAYSLYKTF